MKQFQIKTKWKRGLLVGVSLIILTFCSSPIRNSYAIFVPQTPTPTTTKTPVPSVTPLIPTPDKSPGSNVFPSVVTKIISNNHGKKYLIPFMEKRILTSIEETGRAEIYGINFDFDRAEIRSDSEATLTEIAAILEQNPSLRVYIVGHTDMVGDFQYNLKLSQLRAEAVMEALITRYGIEFGRLTSYGVGQMVPIVSNDTDEGRFKNRRVELVKRIN